MESGPVALLVFVCGYVLVCDGHPSDIMTPCGPRLCEYLCDVLNVRSSHTYHVKNYTCAPKTRSLGVCKGDMRTCRNIKSRRGKHVRLCSAPTKKRHPVDCNGATINLGDAVDIEPPKKLWIGAIYVGNGKVIMYDSPTRVAMKRSMNSIADPITKFKCQPEWMRVFNGKKRAKRAVHYYKQGSRNLQTTFDFLSWCYTGKRIAQARTKNFKLGTGL